MNSSLIPRALTLAVMSTLCFSTLLSEDTKNIYWNPQMAPACDFSRPLAYSRESITHFLKNVYNHPSYAQDFLALNFAHVTQLMSLAPKHPHPRRFIRKGLGLFSLKLQDIKYLNAYAFCAFLEDLITYVAPYTDTERDKSDLVEAFKQTIGAFLVDNFEVLREEPDAALGNLSLKLYDLVHDYEKRDISIREIQHVMHYFLSQALNLLVWSPENQEDTWHCMVAIGNRLEQCAAYNLVDRDMLDDLYWILLHRYAYFLSLAGPELDPAFFDCASSALQTMKNGFWYTDEREMYITTKYDFLQKALIQEDAVSRLIKAGYVQ